MGVRVVNIVELRVTVRNGVRAGVRVKVRVRVRVSVRFWVGVMAFFNAKLKIFSRRKMTSCNSGGWKQVTTVVHKYTKSAHFAWLYFPCYRTFCH